MGSAPCSTKKRTTSMWPCPAAFIRAVSLSHPVLGKPHGLQIIQLLHMLLSWYEDSGGAIGLDIDIQAGLNKYRTKSRSPFVRR